MATRLADTGNATTANTITANAMTGVAAAGVGRSWALAHGTGYTLSATLRARLTQPLGLPR